jgi:hypothetical protein
MNKVNTLFKKYYRILNEQEPAPEAAPPEAAPAEMEQEPTPTEPVQKPLDENEKYVIKILTNSFIFNPTLFSSSKKKFIANKINNIKKTINVPVSQIIAEIKSILNLDNSLKIESKTLKILNRYMVVLEQPADATEPQADNNTTPTISNNPQNPSISSVNNLNLVEIFPLYKELILQALAHAPTEEELIILKPIVNEFADSDPEKIVVVIKDLLNQESDKAIEGDLANA